MADPTGSHNFDEFPLDFEGLNQFATTEEAVAIARYHIDAITSGPTYGHRIVLMNRAARLLAENDMLGNGGWMIVPNAFEPGMDAFSPGVRSDEDTTKAVETAISFTKDEATGVSALRIMQGVQLGEGSNHRFGHTLDVTVDDFGAVMNVDGGHITDTPELCEASKADFIQIAEGDDGKLELDARFVSTPLSGFYAYPGDDLEVVGMGNYISLSDPNCLVDQWDAWYLAYDLLNKAQDLQPVAGSYLGEEIVKHWQGGK